MIRNKHAIINGVSTIAFAAFLLWIHRGEGLLYITWALLKCTLWYVMTLYFGPDVDQSDYIGLKHRSAWTHSILFPLLFTACLWGIPQTSAILVPYSAHILADLAPSENGKRVGSWRVNGKWTVKRSAAWFAANGIIGIVIALVLEMS